MRRSTIIAVAAVAAMTVAVPAYAAWATSGLGTANANAGSLGAASAGSAGNPTTTTLDLSWTAPSNPAPASYEITRDNVVIPCDFEAANLGTAKCRDTFASSTTARSFDYQVTPKLHNWTGGSVTFTGQPTTSAAPPTITTIGLADATVGVAYGETLSASGGSGTKVWDISGGALPDGLSLSPAGAISGAPETAGTATFTVRVTDAAGSTTKQLSIAVATAADTTAPTIVSTTAAGGTPRLPEEGDLLTIEFSEAMTAASGSTTVTFARANGGGDATMAIPDVLAAPVDLGSRAGWGTGQEGQPRNTQFAANWSLSGDTLVLTLGARNTSTHAMSQAPAGPGPTAYSVVSGFTDAAGNAVDGTGRLSRPPF